MEYNRLQNVIQPFHSPSLSSLPLSIFNHFQTHFQLFLCCQLQLIPSPIFLLLLLSVTMLRPPLSSSRSLMRLSLDSFLYFAKSNSLPTLIDLISIFILSVHVTLILSYPYIFTLTSTHSLSFLQMRWLFYDVMTGRQRVSTRRRGDDLLPPTRKPPEYPPVHRAAPGRLPR